MNKDTVVRFRKKDEVVDPLVELLRNGATRIDWSGGRGGIASVSGATGGAA